MTDDITLNDGIDRYERECVPLMRPRSQKDVMRHLRVLREWKGAVHPDAIKPRDIGMFLDVPTGKIHRNRQVSVLSAIYTKMVGRWYLAEKNPCIGVERNPSRKRDRYVTDAEFEAVRSIMPPMHQVAMDLAKNTAQRQGDLLDLRWTDVDPYERRIYFQQGKTGKKLKIRISAKGEEILTRARRIAPLYPRTHVIRSSTGEPYTREGFRAIWQRKMREAHRKGLIKTRFTFHDLRAKSVSDTRNFQEAYERAGHTSPTMTRSVYDRAARNVEPLE